MTPRSGVDSPVPVEVTGWVTRFVGGGDSGRRVFEEALPSGATLRTVLRGLTARVPAQMPR